MWPATALWPGTCRWCTAYWAARVRLEAQEAVAQARVSREYTQLERIERKVLREHLADRRVQARATRERLRGNTPRERG